MSDTSSSDRLTSRPTTRRDFVRAGAVSVAGAAALSTAGTASAQGEDYDGWLGDVSNYDGTVVDERGSDTVTIEVGAQANGGPYGFGPPAVQVTPGTSVVWEWVEGYHNVVDDAGAFESEQTDEVGFTFEYTPEETGVVKYFCGPHETMGMKGVLEVAEGAGSESGGGTAQAGNTSAAMGSSGDGGVGGIVVSALALAFLSPAIFAAVRLGRDDDDRPDDGVR